MTPNQTMPLIDLPRHNGAVLYATVWHWICMAIAFMVTFAVSFIAMAIAAYFAVTLTDAELAAELHPNKLVFPGAILSVVAVLSLFFAWNYHRTRRAVDLSAVFGVSGAVYAAGGALIAFLLGKTAGDLGIWALIGFFIGMAHGVVMLFSLIFLELFHGIRKVALYVPAKIVSGIFKILFPAWKKHVGLTSGGLAWLHFGDARFFVVNKELRREGKAAELGIPTFTWAELKNAPGVRARLKEWAGDKENRALIESALPGTLAATFGAATLASMDFATFDFDTAPIGSPFMDINPATGLPMIADTPIDVMGNPIGMDLAPGPMPGSDV